MWNVHRGCCGENRWLTGCVYTEECETVISATPPQWDSRAFNILSLKKKRIKLQGVYFQDICPCVSLNVPFWTLTPVELARCQLDLAELGRLIQMLQCLEGDLPITNVDLEKRISMQVSGGFIYIDSVLYSNLYCSGLESEPSSSVEATSTAHCGLYIEYSYFMKLSRV